MTGRFRMDRRDSEWVSARRESRHPQSSLDFSAERRNAPPYRAECRRRRWMSRLAPFCLAVLLAQLVVADRLTVRFDRKVEVDRIEMLVAPIRPATEEDPGPCGMRRPIAAPRLEPPGPIDLHIPAEVIVGVPCDRVSVHDPVALPVESVLLHRIPGSRRSLVAGNVVEVRAITRRHVGSSRDRFDPGFA